MNNDLTTNIDINCEAGNFSLFLLQKLIYKTEEFLTLHAGLKPSEHGAVYLSS